MDELIMYSSSVEKNVNYVDEIITIILEPGVDFKMKKCMLWSDKLEYIGHVINLREVNNTHTTSLRQ